MRKSKFDYEYVKCFIEENSECKLLSKKYNNTEEKLLLECSCGDKFYVNFYEFRRKKRICNKCSKNKYWDKNRITLEDIFDYVYKNGDGTILTQNNIEYNPEKKLEFICKCGKIFYTTFI